MMNAYDSGLVNNAQLRLGWMLDFAVNVYGYELNRFYNMFLRSDYSDRFAVGDASVIEGHSGRELAYLILETENSGIEQIENNRYLERSREFWTGWSLAYFQWETSLRFGEIEDFCNILEVRDMYNPFHEMDITQFCDRMKELYISRNPDSQLKKIRKIAGLSQKDLAERTGIPLRTIQQYEQKQKNINHARVDYLISLSHELSCDIEMLVEKII